VDLGGGRLCQVGTVIPRPNGTVAFTLNTPEPGTVYNFLFRGFNASGRWVDDQRAWAVIPAVTQAAVVNGTIIDRLKLEANYAQAADGRTFCNLALEAMTDALSKRWGVNAKVRAKPDATHNTWVTASGQYNWLMSGSSGYRQLSAAEAQRQANLGHIVVAAWKNPSGGESHVGLVRATTEPFQASRGPRIAQAGRQTFSSDWAIRGFGSYLPQTRYFVYTIP